MLQWVAVKEKQMSELRSLKGMHLQLLFSPYFFFSKSGRNDTFHHLSENILAELYILEAML